MLELGLCYHNFNAARGRTPDNVQELQAFAQDSYSEIGNLLQNAFEIVEQGEVIVVWNGSFADSHYGMKVLAYQANVPDSGGIIVDGGGATRIVSATEFSKLELMVTREPSSNHSDGAKQ